MRALLGVLGLLIVVALIGLIARQQLHAVASVDTGASAPVALPQGSPRQIEQRVQQDVERSLQQGAAATASAADQ
jgi:hypothetical protein